MPRSSVLVVEDDPDVCALVEELLVRAGHDVHTAEDGRAGVRALFSRRPDLVVLDIGLPALDGWSVLERIREVADVPVLVLTALGTEPDKVRALRGGADDYLTKPFGRQELLARVDALLRRAGGEHRGVPEDATIDDGALLIDPVAHDVRFHGRPLELSPLEFRLLQALAEHPGQVLSGDQLLERCWHDSSGLGRDRVKVYIGYLRRKLREAGEDPIDTVRGFGYRYRAPAA